MREGRLCNAESGGRRDRARFRLTMKCVSIAVALAVEGACAHAPPPRPAPAPMRPPYRSSIAAVLALRAELGLTDEQAKKLEEIDDQLQVANAAIRAENPHSDRARGPHRTAATDGTSPGSGRDLSGEPLQGDQEGHWSHGRRPRNAHGWRTRDGRGRSSTERDGQLLGRRNKASGRCARADGRQRREGIPRSRGSAHGGAAAASTRDRRAVSRTALRVA